MMALLDVLGKIAWVRLDFQSQGKISDILIRCARMKCSLYCPLPQLHNRFALLNKMANRAKSEIYQRTSLPQPFAKMSQGSGERTMAP